MTIDMIVALIGASVVAYTIANRFRLIAPVLLIAAGVGVALLPVGEEMYLPSTVVLTIFLPILLYWESLSVSLNRMRRSLRGIILSATPASAPPMPPPSPAWGAASTPTVVPFFRPSRFSTTVPP